MHSILFMDDLKLCILVVTCGIMREILTFEDSEQDDGIHT